MTRVHPRLGGAVASVSTGLPLAPLPALLPLLRRRRLPTPHLPSWLLLLLLPWLLEPAVPAALCCAVPLTAPLPRPAMLDLLRPALRFGRLVRWRPMRLPRLPLPLVLPAASSLLVSPTPLVSLALLPLRQRRAGGAPCDLRIDLHCRSSFWITGGFLPPPAGPLWQAPPGGCLASPDSLRAPCSLVALYAPGDVRVPGVRSGIGPAAGWQPAAALWACSVAPASRLRNLSIARRSSRFPA